METPEPNHLGPPEGPDSVTDDDSSDFADLDAAMAAASAADLAGGRLKLDDTDFDDTDFDDTAEADESPEEFSAPPVVAIMVTHNPGEWFDQALEGLRTQDYADFTVLIVDADSDQSPTARVAAILPDAYVHQLDANPGFGAVINEAVGMVEGAPFILCCHDDTALDPSAVRVLVEEAIRSNAAIVGPKVVDLDHPDVLCEVGMTIDHLGTPTTGLEPGEIDQEQHDGVRDVFYVTSTAMLIRTDLFNEIGGFRAERFPGAEDLDLCWRARIAGARVMVAPDARVRHRSAAGLRGELSDPQVAQKYAEKVLANRVRTLLANSSGWSLTRSLLAAMVIVSGEAAAFVVTKRRYRASALVRAWTGNLRDVKSLRSERQSVEKSRLVADHDLVALQASGSTRLRAYLAGHFHTEDRLAALSVQGQSVAARTSAALRRPIGATIAVLAVLVVFGSRLLIWKGVPATGSFLPWPRAGELFEAYGSGWRFSALGSDAPAPPGAALMGLFSTLTFGHSAAALTILIVAAIPMGALGVFRLVRPFASSSAPAAAAAVAYGINPVARNAIGEGELGVLVLFVVLPLAIRLVLRAAGMDMRDTDEDATPTRVQDASEGAAEPDPDLDDAGLLRALFPLDQEATETQGAIGGPRDALDFSGPITAHMPLSDESVATDSQPSQPQPQTRRPHVIGLALLLAVATSFYPLAILLVPIAAFAFVMASPFGAERQGTWRGLRFAIIASAIALVVLLPWPLALLTGQIDGSALGIASRDPISLVNLAQFRTGPNGAIGSSGLLIAAALPLLVSRGGRFARAVRSWGLVLAALAMAWIPGRFSIPGPIPEGPLVLAALGIALAVASGLAAVVDDLHSFHFGWRQLAPIAAAVAMMLASTEFIAAGVDGRFGLPSRNWNQSLAWTSTVRSQGSFRILWLGDPTVVPGQAWVSQGGSAYTVSRDGPPNALDLFPVSASETAPLGEVVGVAESGMTSRLGHLLAPMGIRYVVVLERLGPNWGPTVPADSVLVEGLSRQLDLAALRSESGMTLFENSAWAPIRTVLPEGLGEITDGVPLRSGLQSELSEAVAISGPMQGSTSTDSGGMVLWSEQYDQRWQASVTPANKGGRSTELTHLRSLGWANAYALRAPGKVSIIDAEQWRRNLILIAQFILWLGALWIWRRRRAGVMIEDDTP